MIRFFICLVGLAGIITGAVLAARIGRPPSEIRSGDLTDLDSTRDTGRFQLEHQCSFRSSELNEYGVKPIDRNVYIMTDTVTMRRYIVVEGCGLTPVELSRGVEK